MTSGRRLFVGAIPVAAAAGGVAATLLFGPATRGVIAQDTAGLTAVQLATATSLEGAFMRVSDTVGPATVSITARPTRTGSPRPEEEGEEGDEDELFNRRNSRSSAARGSGVIVRPDGYILTNDHIVEEARGSEVLVTLADGTEYRGKAFRDSRSDLAVVKIESEKPLPYVRLGDSNRIKVGQWAIAIGSPFGQQNTMTTGIVSALHRKKTITDGGLPRFYPNLIQTDASINPGNSGGPLLNINGEIIGINVAIFSPTGTSLGIGYAIPTSVAKRVMEQLIEKGAVTRGSLGIVPTDIPAALRKRLGTTTGAYVSEVAPETPAETAGILPDDVVTSYNGQTILEESQLRELIAATEPGTKVSLSILRGGMSRTVSATLTSAREAAFPSRPEPVSSPVAISKRRTSKDLGFEARVLTHEVREASGLDKTLSGLLVHKVAPGSPAWDADLAPNSVITGLNGTPVTSVAALEAAIQAAKPGDAVTLIVQVFDRSGKAGKAAVNIIVP